MILLNTTEKRLHMVASYKPFFFSFLLHSEVGYIQCVQITKGESRGEWGVGGGCRAGGGGGGISNLIHDRCVLQA